MLKLVFMVVGRPAVGHVRATWVWGEAGLGGAGIAPGGHVAQANMLRIGFTIIYICYIQKRKNILTHYKNYSPYKRTAFCS